MSQKIKKMERKMSALFNNKALVKSIIQNAADGIIITKKDGSILICNPAAGAIFGYKPEELFENPLKILLPENQKENYAEYISEDGREIEGRHKNGKTLNLEIGISKVPSGRSHLLMAIIRNITERKKSEAKLSHMANYDQLTGLKNRKLFDELLKQKISQAKRHSHSFALMFLDLNHFKNVNDKYGHKTGDMLLKRIARTIVNSVRESDIIARVGGDEFTIILEIQSKKDCETVAEKIIKSVTRNFEISGKKVKVGVSIGIAIYPQDGIDNELLVKHADKAMYRAKKHNKSAFEFYKYSLFK